MKKLLPRLFPKFYNNPSKRKVSITSSIINTIMDCTFDIIFVTSFILYERRHKFNSNEELNQLLIRKNIQACLLDWSCIFFEYINYLYVPIFLRASIKHL